MKIMGRDFWRQKTRKILVTGGMVFVNKYVAEYYIGLGDAVLDITAYTQKDVACLLDALGDFKNYILVSSSAVYLEQYLFNLGNEETVSIREWVKLCYGAVEKEIEYIEVHSGIERRNYFSFYNYEYRLDVTKQRQLLKDTIPLKEGLKESYEWYKEHMEQVKRKEYLEYIDHNFIG